MLFWRAKYENGEKLDGIGELRENAANLAHLVDCMGLHARGKFI